MRFHLPPQAEWTGGIETRHVFKPNMFYNSGRKAFTYLPSPAFSLNGQGDIEFSGLVGTGGDVQLIFHTGPETKLELLSLELHSDDVARSEKIMAGAPIAKPITEWRPHDRTAQTKNWRYLAGVTLGWGVDSSWRCSEDAGRAVYQAVAPIPAPASMEIRGERLPEIVQFSLTGRGQKRRQGFLLWHEMNPVHFMHASGLPAVRLDIYNGLAAKGYDPQHTDLLEPIFYFRDPDGIGLEQLNRIHCDALVSTSETTNSPRVSSHADGENFYVSIENLARYNSGLAVKGRLGIRSGELLGISARMFEPDALLSPVRARGLWALDSLRIPFFADLQQSRLKAWFSLPANKDEAGAGLFKMWFHDSEEVKSLLMGHLIDRESPIGGRLWLTYGALYGEDGFNEQMVKDCLLTVVVKRNNRLCVLTQEFAHARPERVFEVLPGDVIIGAEIKMTTLVKDLKISDLSVPFYLIDVVEAGDGFDYLQYTWITPAGMHPARTTASVGSRGTQYAFQYDNPASEVIFDYEMDLPLRLDFPSLPGHMRANVYVNDKFIKSVKASPSILDLAPETHWGANVRVCLSTKKPGIYTLTPPILHGLDQMRPEDLFWSIPGWEDEIDALKQRIAKEDISGRNIWFTRVNRESKKVEKPPADFSQMYSLKDSFLTPVLRRSAGSSISTAVAASIDGKGRLNIIMGITKIIVLLICIIAAGSLLTRLKMLGHAGKRVWNLLEDTSCRAMQRQGRAPGLAFRPTTGEKRPCRSRFPYLVRRFAVLRQTSSRVIGFIDRIRNGKVVRWMLFCCFCLSLTGILFFEIRKLATLSHSMTVAAAVLMILVLLSSRRDNRA